MGKSIKNAKANIPAQKFIEVILTTGESLSFPATGFEVKPEGYLIIEGGAYACFSPSSWSYVRVCALDPPRDQES